MADAFDHDLHHLVPWKFVKALSEGRANQLCCADSPKRSASPPESPCRGEVARFSTRWSELSKMFQGYVLSRTRYLRRGAHLRYIRKSPVRVVYTLGLPQVAGLSRPHVTSRRPVSHDAGGIGPRPGMWPVGRRLRSA